MKLIQFEDKLKTLNINGKYIISSENVNEIKNVVNSLCDSLITEDFYQNSIFKYIVIILPNCLENFEYDLKVYFNDICVSTSELTDNFMVFENGSFNIFKKQFFTIDDASKVVLVKTPENIQFDGLKVRYHLINVNEQFLDNYYPADYSVFKKTNEENSFNELKYFTIKSKNDLTTINYALQNGIFDKVKDRINYYYLEDAKPNNIISVSGMIFDNGQLINVSSESIELRDHLFEIGSSSSYDINGEYSGQTFTKSVDVITFPGKIQTDLIFNKISSLSDKDNLKYETYIKNFDETVTKENITPIETVYVNNEGNNSNIRSLLFKHNDLESEFFIKTQDPAPNKLEVTLNLNSISPFEQEAQFTGRIIYSDGTSNDVVFDPNDKSSYFICDNLYNKLELCKSGNTNSIKLNGGVSFNETKLMLFKHSGLFCIVPIKIDNAPSLSLTGELLTSDGETLNKNSIISNFLNFTDIEQNDAFDHTSNKDDVDLLKDLKQINQELTIEKYFGENDEVQNINLNDLAPGNHAYYKCSINYKSESGELVHIKSVNLPGTVDFIRGKTFVLIYSSVSNENEGVMFVKDKQIKIDTSFKNNYVVGFKNLKLNVSMDNALNKNVYLEILSVSGQFRDIHNNEHNIPFIYEELNDLWVIGQVPIKLSKLTHINISFSFIKK